VYLQPRPGFAAHDSEAKLGFVMGSPVIMETQRPATVGGPSLPDFWNAGITKAVCRT
jgi:hypothetical protein